MAKPSWLTVSPMSGSGNDTLRNTATVYKGRKTRSGTVTVTGSGVAQPKTYKVTQEAEPEYISIDNGSSMAADKTGGKVTVNGKSNSAALSFAWVGEAKEATISPQYTAGGKPTNNTEAIEGDPGATGEVVWSVDLTLPANTIWTISMVSSSVYRMPFTKRLSFPIFFSIPLISGPPP